MEEFSFVRLLLIGWCQNLASNMATMVPLGTVLQLIFVIFLISEFAFCHDRADNYAFDPSTQQQFEFGEAKSMR